MFLLFSTKIVIIVSSKCPVFLNMTTMLRISTTALIQAPACIISVETTLVLNPWCSGARVVYVRTSGTHPPQCKVVHDSQSVLSKLEKSQETWSKYTSHGNSLPHLHNLYPTHASALMFSYPLGRD